MKLATRGVALAALAAAPIAAHQAVAVRTTSDAVFTREQATRGRVLYGDQCAASHGPALGGVEMAPPLTGPEFFSNWSDLQLDDLFQRISRTMPLTKPGTLSRQQTADVVAFILDFNKAPAGQVELPADAEALKIIRIVSAN